MIYTYGDDGADERKERVIAVAVIAEYEDWWEELELSWVPRCNGIPFHAKDCESDQGDYRGVRHDENKALYRDLTTILAESKLGGIAIAIDLVAQRKILPNALPLAYHRAFVEALVRVAHMSENLRDVSELTFDVSTRDEYNAGLLYSYMRHGDPKLFNWLHPTISFVSAKHSARIQTADLLAYEGWKALDHTVGSQKRKRKSWEILRSTERFETYSYSDEWFTDLRAHIQSGDLEKIVGFNENNYKHWLEKMNRQHNLSNLFTFSLGPDSERM